ncbi:MAG: hypothetical protein GC157_14550 [Frankiales bacterium]|nr:hypothetical protein [Frankiales bacterium]
MLTHGPLATPPAFAVADTDAGRSGDTKASLFAVTPSSTAPSYNWASEQISASDDYPATLPGALSGNTHAAVSTTFLWFDPSAGHPFYYPNNDANAAWQGLYQLRMYTSGPGQSIDTTRYSSATIAVDQVAGEWTQIYPTPSVTATATSVTAPVPSVTSPAAAGTAITLTSVASAGADHPAGTIQFKDGGTDLGAAVAVDGSGSATSASFTPASGSHSFTAVFTPTDTTTYSGSTSTATSFSVDAVPADDTTTSIDMVDPAATADTSTPIHVTVTVADSTTPATTPTGAVSVKADGTEVGTGTLDGSGEAVVTIPASTLTIGDHTLTADYAGNASFNASSTASGTAYSITLAAPADVSAPTVGGARVGAASTCTAGVWTYAGTYSYAWYLDSATTPFATTARTAALPAGYAGHRVTCTVTATNPAGSASASSAAVKVALGAAPRATVRPSILGLYRGYALVGRTVKARVGSWSPRPSRYAYTWKVNGHVVSHRSSLRIGTAWRGKTLVLVVTTVKPGYATGAASSRGARVR